MFPKKIVGAYLKAGMGVPWAGHVRAIPEPLTLSNADELRMDGNCGFALPIGSMRGKRGNNGYKNFKFLLPKSWNG